MKRRSLSLRDIALVGTMTAVLEAGKIALTALPNIEVVTLLLILYTLYLPRQVPFVIPLFVVIEGLRYGFGLWWLPTCTCGRCLHWLSSCAAPKRGSGFGACFPQSTACCSGPSVLPSPGWSAACPPPSDGGSLASPLICCTASEIFCCVCCCSHR